MTDIRLLVFARAPEEGSIKTRLIPALGKAGAAALYRHLLENQLRQVAGDLHIELWCTPDTGHPHFAAVAARHGLTLHAQRGETLGERMHHALADALQRSDGALLIGSDLPTMDHAVLQDARDALQHNDVVLVPAEDGGYGLIGLRQADSLLFEDIPWGTAQVLEATRARLRRRNVRWAELPPVWDVDRPEDLLRLRRLPGWDAVLDGLVK
ncbi:MAG: flagellar biosynthesis protein FlgB [Gammaproteobacteria bacterium HGW-Gammaproteobacteria-1]|jgi:hypothetical protein|nr:MAG: flagellar biosynthesis protein FlgB [Gammaproteobacteria bacterium HGW-Gammaproteobacteria-1]